MPEKATEAGQRYAIDGKTFTWTTETGDQVTIPMRIKLKVIRGLAGQDMNNASTMFAILEQIIPGQADVLDEMDLNDFVTMFGAWNAEYNMLSGATLGEASPSAD